MKETKEAFRARKIRQLKGEDGFFDFDEIKRVGKAQPKPKRPQSKATHDISNFALRLNRNPATLERKSCVRFEKTKQGAREHNFREYSAEREPDYILPKEYRLKNDFWELTNEQGHAIKPQELFKQELVKYGKGKGKRPRYENSTWECVVLLNAQHDMSDLHKVREYIEKTLNITCYAMAIHRDEGYLNKDKTPIYNYHAHLNFVTIKDKAQNFRLTKTKRLMPAIQSEVAKILNMPRGEPNSKSKHLQPKEYRNFKAQELKIQNLKNELEKERAQKNEQKAQIETLAREKDGVKAENSTLKAEIEKMKNELNGANAKIAILESKFAKTAEALSQEKEKQPADKIRPQNDKNGSNFVENQKNIELPQKEKENDLQAKLDILARKLNENMDKFSYLISSSKPKYLQEMLNQAVEIQTLLVKSPSLNALNADKTLKRFDSFCKTQNLSIQRT